eukprot:6195413-Pleurochrysis_carterae.AAC.1
MGGGNDSGDQMARNIDYLAGVSLGAGATKIEPRPAYRGQSKRLSRGQTRAHDAARGRSARSNIASRGTTQGPAAAMFVLESAQAHTRNTADMK